VERVPPVIAGLDRLAPSSARPQQVCHVQAAMAGRVFLEVGTRQIQQRDGRSEPVFLKMHERSGQLDQGFEEIGLGAAAAREPKGLKGIVSLEESLLVEQGNVIDVARRVIRAGRSEWFGIVPGVRPHKR
jgi:hypothetical protein